jgi:hypothetical protein
LETLWQQDFAPTVAPSAAATRLSSPKSDAARSRLEALVPQPPEVGEPNRTASRHINTLVFDANAASAVGQFDRADALDKALLDALAAASPDEAARLKPSLLQISAELAGLYRAQRQQEELLRQTTDAAQIPQRQAAVDELHRSSQQTLLRLAQQRLQMIPSLAVVFAASDEEPAASVLAASFLRRAGGLRSGHPTTLPESVAPAYQEAVRAYFDALAHSRDEKPKR